MRFGKKILAFILIIILATSIAPMTKANAKEKNSAKPEGMKKVLENEYLSFYINEDDASVAIVDLQTGNIWYSNPVAADEDSMASAYYKRVLKSQLQIQYYNDSVQSSTMDSYSDSVANGQFEIEKTDNDVTVTYTFGDGATHLLLPDSITEERMNSFVNNMDDKAKKKINRNYTLTDGIYTLRGGVKDYLKEELEGYFIEAGYTEEDYNLDLEAAGASSEEDEKPWFIIPITYSLDDDNLVVSINPNNILYNENGFYLVDIDVLPFLGAGYSDDGYIFVPDGSGALINFNNGKTTSSSYSAVVYGQDLSKQVLSNSKSEINVENTIKMPVFGIKDGAQALFAVIENGDGYADITADISGKTTSYNNVYAGFSYLQYGEASLSDMVGSNSYNLYGNKSFSSDYKLRYFFLSDTEADYSGMAKTYRNYLISNGYLTTEVTNEDIPFFTEFIGAIDKDKTFLGFKYHAVETLTNYEEAEAVVEQLKANDISNQNVIFSGWSKGGIEGVSNLNLEKNTKLESGSCSIDDFIKKLQDINIDSYFTIDLQCVYQDTLTDGYSKMKNSPGYFDHTDITMKNYNIADGSYKDEKANLISPVYSELVTDKVRKKLNKYEIEGVNLGTATWLLYSDFLEDQYTDRQAAIEKYKESYSELALGEKLLGDNANAYSLAYISKMTDVPLSSNGYLILDEEIPFYEIVVHGYIEYAGEAINMADDYTTIFLKSVESGAGLKYQWITRDNSLLKDTDYENLYSVNVSTWLDTAIEDYSRLRNDTIGLENQLIVKHEIISSNLRKTIYEDGTIVYVNYGNEQVSIDGINVDAKDYYVKRGE